MKKSVVLALAFALVAGAAYGALGDIVASWAAPENYPIAAARANNSQYFWLYCNAGDRRIWRVNADTGSVYASYVSPHSSYTRGLTYNYNGGGGLPSGSYLWMGNYSTDYIYRCNYTTGSAYASFSAGHDMYGGLAAMATADGGAAPTHMLSSDSSPAYTWRQSLTNGSVYGSFATTGCYDIAWDWRNELMWHRNGSVIYGRNTSGSIVGSFAFSNGPALGFAYHGQYLWLASTSGYHAVFKVHCPGPGVSVTPTSAGKIKALYH
ncbi:MAG: hypothetical protein PVH29_09080 [Candidatus Zixiibacteriota bacterium]|jgi:hypothetical protein